MTETVTKAVTGTAPTKPIRKYKSLTPEEEEHFLTKGWLRVPGAIKQKYIDEFMSDFWIRLGWDEHDKSTWTEEYVHQPRHREVPAEEYAPVAWDKICDIVGGEDKIDPVRERYYGDAFVSNFGSEARSKEKRISPGEKDSWHCDDDWYRQFLDSSGNALTIVHCFTDILGDGGGGTLLCEDGIAGVVQTLYNHPEGLEPPVRITTDHIRAGKCKQFTTVEAKAGDVLILHALLPHTNSFNYRHYARVISNPHVSLHSPYNLNRADGDYTLCERVILRGLGRDSVPEYKPTRERAAYFPRHAGFKNARAPAEAQRMVAAAKAKGIDESKVNSVWLRGDKAIEEMNRRNGFDLPPREEDGVLMVQHSA